MRQSIVASLLLSLSLFLPQCSKDASVDPKPEFENAEISDDTIVMDEVLSAAVSGYEASSGQLTLVKTADSKKISRGDILVSPPNEKLPWGLLCKISSVEKGDETLTLRTEAATITQAFASLSIACCDTLAAESMHSGTLSAPAKAAETAIQATAITHSFSKVLAGTQDNPDLIIAGTISLEPGVAFSMTVQDHTIQSLSCVLTCAADIVFSVTGTGELEIDQVLPLLDSPLIFDPIVIEPGIVIQPVLTLSAGVSGQTGGDVDMAISHTGTITSGVSYDGARWAASGEADPTFQFDTPSLAGNTALEGYVKARLDMNLYGVAGPSLEAAVQGRLSADVTAEPWWQLFGGCQSEVSVGQTVLGTGCQVQQALNIEELLASAQTPYHQIRRPAAPQGEAEAEVNTDLTFETGSAVCSQGHATDYRFDWGDGSLSPWQELMQTHSYAVEGQYEVKAQARCKADTGIVSAWSSPAAIRINPVHAIQRPDAPGGVPLAIVGDTVTAALSGAACSWDHDLHYAVDWGDGSPLSWSTGLQSHVYAAAGQYQVTAKARCLADTTLESEWSDAWALEIRVTHTLSRPGRPTGPATATVDVPAEFTPAQALCSWEHSIAYRFNWNDGSNMSWNEGPQTHSFATVGTYYVQTQARCTQDTTLITEWSDSLAVTVSEFVYWSVSGECYIITPAGSKQNVADADITLRAGDDIITAQSGSDGNWQAQVPEGWTGTVRAEKEGYDFRPYRYDLVNVTSAQTGLNFYEDQRSQTVNVTFKGCIPMSGGWAFIIDGVQYFDWEFTLEWDRGSSHTVEAVQQLYYTYTWFYQQAEAFVEWDDGYKNTERTIITPDHDKTYKVIYDAFQPFDISAGPGGSVSTSVANPSFYATHAGMLRVGTLYNLNAIPASGYHFVEWQIRTKTITYEYVWEHYSGSAYMSNQDVAGSYLKAVFEAN